ncbi:MAG: hypothetical protein WDN26_01725 [Chitinophagaceae bacterium]
MIFYLLFFLLIQVPQHDIVYFQKKQICSSVDVINKEWHLKLKGNRTFEYTVSEFSTLKYKQGIKDDTLVFNGLWELNNDTIVLHSRELTNYCKTEVRYRKKGNDLFSLGARIDSVTSYQIRNLNLFSGHKSKKG